MVAKLIEVMVTSFSKAWFILQVYSFEYCAKEGRELLHYTIYTQYNVHVCRLNMM